LARPYWSGQIQISLVAFGVQLFPAIEAKSEIRFHEVSRKSGERVRHQKVTESEAADSEAAPVEKDDIVKGYEYSKGQFVYIEPEEIKELRAAARQTVQIEQFIGMDELDPALLEKPYFVTPQNDSQAEAFAVVRKALKETGKAGLGRIAASGRERLIAICAPQDDKLAGMMAYVLRYPEELRSAQEYFAGIKTPAVDDDQLSLAKELIKRKTGKFDPGKFKDEYEIALRELIDSKIQRTPMPKEQEPARPKVVNLMDALRRSVSETSQKKPVARVGVDETKAGTGKSKLKLVKPHAKAPARRKTA
jgi:DNA end-binding protein Ku